MMGPAEALRHKRGNHGRIDRRQSRLLHPPRIELTFLLAIRQEGDAFGYLADGDDAVSAGSIA